MILDTEMAHYECIQVKLVIHNIVCKVFNNSEIPLV